VGYQVWPAEGEQLMHTQARKTALGGMLAALAVVLMTMGGMIPVRTAGQHDHRRQRIPAFRQKFRNLGIPTGRSSIVRKRIFI
jgi:hypothetical protein